MDFQIRKKYRPCHFRPMQLITLVERKPALGTSISLIIIAAIGGIAVALQAQFMGLMDKQIGTLEGVFITYGGGGLLVGLAMLLSRGGNLAAWQGVPWYALSSGCLGLVIVGTIGYGTARLGLVTAMTIIVAAQFITGAVLDHFGVLGAQLRPLDLTRFAGIGLMLLGTWLVIR
jgi:transporter family-2 protein